MKKDAIVICGQPGAGSSTIGKELAKILGMNYFTAGGLFKDISMGVHQNQYYYPVFDEICKAKGLEIPVMSSENASQGVVDLWNTEFGSSRKFHKAIDELTPALARRGNIIIDGKLAIYFVRDSGLKVWLKASDHVRAKRLYQRDGTNLEKIRDLLIVREEKERKEWKRIYGIDYWEQEKNADLIIDTTDISYGEAVERILKERESQQTS